VIAQASVPVLPGDTAETLAARVLAEEHALYPRAIRWFLDGQLQLGNGKVRVKGEHAPLVHGDRA
jgi:phosphoribosylglycinamide formyltransferase-1